MSIDWKPKRSLQECLAIMGSPGQMFETELQMVDGRLLKVYKNIWPTLRHFFLFTANQNKDKELAVFEGDRLTYSQCLIQAAKIATILRDVYGVKKGDRVAIVSRNYPEYFPIFWGIQLLGGVSVMVNAWVSTKALHHCLTLTKPTVVFVDCERSGRLNLSALRSQAGTKAFVVIRPHENPGAKFNGMLTLDKFMDQCKVDPRVILAVDPGTTPDDNATIFFTSGTTGLPKGVLATQRSFLTNIPNSLAGRVLSVLRRGEMPTPPDASGPQKGLLLSVPLFHVTGFTALSMLAHLMAVKIVLLRKWDIKQAVEIIKKENVAIAGGVPSIVSDLIDSDAAGAPSLESFLFGGAPAHVGLAPLAAKTFPAATVSQAYGLTETNAVCVAHAGEDYVTRPGSCGVASPVNELAIVRDGKVMKPGEVGELWVKGANVMRGYYNDPAATQKAITPDGWFKTGDIAIIDKEGFVYIKDRIKDIIIRGGENIDSTTVENAIYTDDRVMEVAAVGVPDKRLGELVCAVVTPKDHFKGEVKEEELLELAAKTLPKHAVPVMIIVQDERLERNPAGKIVKQDIRKRAAKAWEQRSSKGRKSKAKL